MNPLEFHHENQETILIVDDFKANLKLLTYILGADGYQISFALSGKEALEKLIVASPDLPDLILLDLMMPDMNGIEVCQVIKSNPDYQDIPIIFLTASQEEHYLIEAFELGASDYVTKPFRQPELLMRVKTQLTIKRQAQEIIKLNHELQEMRSSSLSCYVK